MGQLQGLLPKACSTGDEAVRAQSSREKGGGGIWRAKPSTGDISGPQLPHL